jgi:chemotaxis signal transduction protein
MTVPTPRHIAAPASDLAPGEELVLLRSGAWRFLVPMRHVERIYQAALPAALPSAGAPRHPRLALGDAMVPVLFGQVLLGAQEVVLGTEDKVVLLREDGGRRALLWVDAVEEIVEHRPVSRGADEPLDLVLGFSAWERPLAVLDVQRFLDLALAEETDEFTAPGAIGEGAER